MRAITISHFCGFKYFQRIFIFVGSILQVLSKGELEVTVEVINNPGQ